MKSRNRSPAKSIAREAPKASQPKKAQAVARESEGVGVNALIRKIKSGELRGRMLDPSDRQRCVEHMTWEGMNANEIADILKVSDRTINRDRAEIRTKNALTRSPNLLPELVGQIVQQSERTSASLRRIARDPATPSSVRVEAERLTFDIRAQTLKTLQSLGYLPTAASEVRTEVIGEMGYELPKFSSFPTQIAQLAALAKKRGVKDDALMANLKQLSDAASALSIAQGIEETRKKLEQGGD